MISIQNYFKSFKPLEAQSVRAFGVGASCYIGLKTLQSNHQFAPHLSKAIIGASAISMLYFGGLLREEGVIRKYCGAGFCIPGLGTVKLGFSANDIISAANNTLKFATDRSREFSKYLNGQ